MSDPPSEARPSDSLTFVARVIILVAILSVWSAITIGIAFGIAEVTVSYQYLSAVLFLFLGHLWGFRPTSLFS